MMDLIVSSRDGYKRGMALALLHGITKAWKNRYMAMIKTFPFTQMVIVSQSWHFWLIPKIGFKGGEHVDRHSSIQITPFAEQEAGEKPMFMNQVGQDIIK